MLQLRQGASAVQPDPRVRVRDRSLSPGVLLPGGGQKTGGTTPAEPDVFTQSTKSCEQLRRLFIRLKNDCPTAGFGEMVRKIRLGTAVARACDCQRGRVWGNCFLLLQMSPITCVFSLFFSSPRQRKQTSLSRCCLCISGERHRLADGCN